jgi:hypothetical protein
MQMTFPDRLSPHIRSLPARLLLMIGLVFGLILGSSGTRKLPPGQRLTIWLNILFFVALGAADEIVLAPLLDRWPLFRAVALTGETLTLGWFFSPGETKPASKTLFFVHIGPFFLAVFAGALSVVTLRHWRVHPA